jgi:hypothetical protein
MVGKICNATNMTSINVTNVTLMDRSDVRIPEWFAWLLVLPWLN